jgi:hypothetical protein
MSPLVLLTPASQDWPEGIVWRGTNQATDPIALGRSLRFEMLTQPDGFCLDSQTGVMEWLPLEDQGPGTNILKVKVTDDANPPRCTTNGFTLVVQEMNAEPKLTSISNRTVNPGQTVAFTVTATDTDLPSNTLTFSLTSAPLGASIDSATGLFQWRPTLSQADTTNRIQLQVMDASPGAINAEHLSNSTFFFVTINPQMRPVLTAVAQKNAPFELLVDGLPGPDYIIQTSLTLTNWFDLTTNTPDSLPFRFVDTNSPVLNRRFYRLQLGP